MALINRVSRLFRADLHAVLDRVEEPGILLCQAVREMEDALARDEQRMRACLHEQRQVEARHRDVEGSLSDIEEELEVCFDSGNDDLARTLIRRKLETQRLLKILVRRRDGAQSALADLRIRVAENRTRLEHMRQKASLLAEKDSPAGTEDDWCAGIAPELTVRDEDVEVAFLREKRQRSRS